MRVWLEGVSLPVSLGERGRPFLVETVSGRDELQAPLQLVLPIGKVECQVGAFSAAANAEAAAARLRRSGLGARIEIRDALHRVLAVGLPQMSVEELLKRAKEAGFPEVLWPREQAYSDVCVQGQSRTVCGAWVRLVPADGAPIALGGSSYRGALEVRKGQRGAAVINVVPLETYLRGVVPAELGPKTFAALEALKAQAVAARTYAVAHLGERADEGWDVCDSVRCQVYAGVRVEHPLSDQAVEETRGLILTYEGKPAQTFFHSTCGGHTESARFQFPQAAAPYLQGVPCAGERELTVGTAGVAGSWLDNQARLELVGEALAVALGANASPAALAAALTGRSTEGGGPALARVFGVEEAGVLVGRSAKVLGEEDLLELLRVFQLPLDPPPAVGREHWELALVVRLGQLVGLVQERAGRLGGDNGRLRLLDQTGSELVPVPPEVRVLERRGGRWREAQLRVQPGSAATLWCAGERCPVLEVEPRVWADEASSWSTWRRELSFEEVGQRLGLVGVSQVRVLQRGVSGRAVQVAVRHAAGETVFPGLAFRYALDLPDSLFVVSSTSLDGVAGVRFLGRGWGHGVGMCQNGAYGLALGGANFAEILAHYYPGTVLAPVVNAR